jgi:hypothetical protein
MISNMTGLEERISRLAFQHWKPRIQVAMVLDELMLVVAAYQSAWTPDDFLSLPVYLVPGIHSSEELMSRAVEASRADVKFFGPPSAHRFLREYALTIAFAASRMRYLQALRSGRTA